MASATGCWAPASRTVPYTKPVSAAGTGMPRHARFQNDANAGTASTTGVLPSVTVTRAEAPDSPNVSKIACCIDRLYVPGGTASNTKRPLSSLVVVCDRSLKMMNALVSGPLCRLSNATPRTVTGRAAGCAVD